jgi:hypothetical protein
MGQNNFIKRKPKSAICHASGLSRLVYGKKRNLFDYIESYLGDFVFQLPDPSHVGSYFGKRATFTKHFLPLFETYITYKNDTTPLETFILAETQALSRLLSTIIQIINSDKFVRLGRIPDVFSVVVLAHQKLPLVYSQSKRTFN